MSGGLTASLLHPEDADGKEAPGSKLETKSVVPVETAGISWGSSKGGKGAKETRSLESFDFDPHESYVNKMEEELTTEKKEQLHDFGRWLLNLAIGFLTAMVAVLISYCSRRLTDWKFSSVYRLVLFEGLFRSAEKEQDGDLGHGTAAVAFVSIALAYAIVAGTIVAFVEPVAAGSGISEIKSVLNGIKIPRVVRLKTLVSKVTGVMFAVGSGLPVGMEGPMIHSGAVVAAGMSQGKSTTLGFDTRWLREKLLPYRNDKEKRDFISCGAAAGVAAAFGAPVGGVLFSLEEGSSFWSRALTWRTMFTAMVSGYTLNFFLSGINSDGKNWGLLSTPGMFTFGTFKGTGEVSNSYHATEIPAFILMGVLGGAIGILFNGANDKLTRWRRRRMATKWRRWLEVIGVSLLVSICAFGLPLVAGKCRTRPKDSSGPGEIAEEDRLVQFYCKDNQYNDVATYFFAPAEKAIRELFHHPDDQDFFGPWRLFLCFLVYGSLTCITYGIAVPSGLFIPSLLTGSALGRMVGLLINQVHPGAVNEGTYSLIGAAAMLGGMARMTVSLAVILLESTGDYQFGLPLIITLMFARYTGNLVNEGLYDLHIEIRGWPLLEERPKPSIAKKLKVSDVMVESMVTFREVERVSSIVSTLQSCTHNGFPVLFSAGRMMQNPQLGTFAGVIHRKHLTVLLQRRAFHREPPIPLLGRSSDGRLVLRSRSFMRESSPPHRNVGDEAAGGARAIGEGHLGCRQELRAGLPQNPPAAVPVGVSSIGPQRSRRVPFAPREQDVSHTVESPARAAAGGRTGSQARSRGASSAETGQTSLAARRLPPRWENVAWEVDRQGVMSADALRQSRALRSQIQDARRERRESMENSRHGPVMRHASGGDLLRRTSRLDGADEERIPLQRSHSAMAPQAQLLGVSPLRDASTTTTTTTPMPAEGEPESERGQGGNGDADRAQPRNEGQPQGEGGRVSLLVGKDTSVNRRSVTGKPRTQGMYTVEEDQYSLGGSSTSTSRSRGLDTEGKPLLTWRDIEGPYPRFPQIEDVVQDLTEEDLDCFVDLRPYMNTTPYTIHEAAPVMRAYRLFRGLGMRHLVATNDRKDAVGILTRWDLTDEHLEACLEHKNERDEAASAEDLEVEHSDTESEIDAGRQE